MDESDKFSDYLFTRMGTNKCTTKAAGMMNQTSNGKFLKWLRKHSMLIVTLSGVIFGVIEGFCLRPLNLTPNTVTLISYPGELFMRLLKLLILPLIISSLISGSASLNARMNGRIAVRTFVYFVLTSVFNASLGICLALIIHPGSVDMHGNGGGTTNPTKTASIFDSLLDLGRNIFPDNLFQASFQQAHTVYVEPNNLLMSLNDTLNVTDTDEMDIVPVETKLIRELHYRSGTNTLGIVFFCLVFGTMLGTIGPKGQVVIDFFSVIFEVVMKMVSGVMWLTPIGVSSVIAGKILSIDNLAPVMMQLVWFILTVAIGVFFYQWIVMQLIYLIIVRKNPFTFYFGLIQPMLMAFATASAAAALPVTFRCMNEKLRVDPRVTRFVLPIGCNINMDGTALYISVASIFIAQMAGMNLGFGELITILLTSTAASMSSASVPSAALVLLLVVLTAIDAPAHDVTLLFAIDWLVDRIRTTNNMLGDCYTAAVVEKLSKRELMALDVAAQDSTANSHIQTNGQIGNGQIGKPEVIVVEMNNSIV